MQTSLVVLLLAVGAYAQYNGQPQSYQQNNNNNNNRQNDQMSGRMNGRFQPTDAQFAQMEAQKQAYISTLSSQAQSAVAQMDSLQQQIHQIFEQQTPSVQQEIDSIHRQGGRGHKGGMRMMNSASSSTPSTQG